jgi:predicted nucleic acid-binding Zn ribbon protein
VVITEAHHHCKVCGKVCAEDAEVCSKSCRAKREANLQRRRTFSYLLYAMIAFLVLLLAANFVHL